MGILSSRSNSRKPPGQMKSETSVADNEIDLRANGGTQDQDEADMAKLGMRQETKVSRWMCLSKNRYEPFTDCDQRRFGLVTILGFTTTMMCTWESALPSAYLYHTALELVDSRAAFSSLPLSMEDQSL
jgi:hypothetical protein